MKVEASCDGQSPPTDHWRVLIFATPFDRNECGEGRGEKRTMRPLKGGGQHVSRCSRGHYLSMGVMRQQTAAAAAGTDLGVVNETSETRRKD